MKTLIAYIIAIISFIAILYLSNLPDYRPYLIWVVLSGFGFLGGVYVSIKPFMGQEVKREVHRHVLRNGNRPHGIRESRS